MSSYSSTYPPIRPVFNADFSNAGRLDSRITFSRSDTPPTYAAPSAVHYWSNEKHLSSDNLLKQSSDFDTSWAANGLNGTPTGGQTDPSGGTDGFTLVEDSSTGIHRVSQNVIASGDLALTVYAKQNSGTRYLTLALYNSTGNTVMAVYDLAGSAPVTASGGSSTFTSITTSQTASGSGYYKCVLKATGTATVAIVNLNDVATTVGLDTNWGTKSYTGDNSSSINVAFASLSSVSSTEYVPTTTQIARAYAPTLKSVSYAGQPRFEYSPTDSASMGLLIEGSSTNLVTYSSDITQSFFTGLRSTRESNVGIAPDGTLTADLLREDSTASNSHGMLFGYNSGGTTPQTISVYAKAAGRNHLSFRFEPTNGVFGGDYVWFNLSTGAVGTTDSDITASIVSCGNGWYRCIATRTALASGNGYVIFYLSDADNSISYSGNSYSGIMLWGPQAEANSSFASSLISTSGSAVTRAADSASAVTSDIGYTGGPLTLFAETTTSATDDYRQGVGIYNSSSEQVAVYGNSYNNRLGYVAGGGLTAVLSQTSANGKSALSIDTNDVAASRNGNSPVTDTSQVLPNLVGATLTVGGSTGSQILNGHVKRVALYGEALSDTNLQAITS